LAAEEGGETNIFNADIGNFIFTLIIFGAVVYILRKFAWKPLLDVLSKRETTIREAIEAAQRERAAAERLLTEYKVQLDKAREESAVLVTEGRHAAEAVARRVHEQARRESEEILARARREIQLAADSARKELHDEAAELAVRVAGRIIQKQLSAADHRALVAESLKEMQASGEAGMN
jgi:F-type H+-transporting ATPase subunit b